MFATNVDWNRLDVYAIAQPGTIYDAGFRGVRSVSTQAGQPQITGYANAGLAICAVQTPQSGGYVPFNATLIEVGNEEDNFGSGSYMTPHDYFWGTSTPDWPGWRAYRLVYPQFAGRFVLGGLASGGQNAVDYAQQVIALCDKNRVPRPDIIAIHPYAKTPDEAAGDFDMMWNAFGLPVVGTEWGYTEQFNAGQLENFQCMLGNQTDGRSTLWNSGFCWTDLMVGGFGIVDSSGAPKESYYGLLGWPDPDGCRM